MEYSFSPPEVVEKDDLELCHDTRLCVLSIIPNPNVQTTLAVLSILGSTLHCSVTMYPHRGQAGIHV